MSQRNQRLQTHNLNRSMNRRRTKRRGQTEATKIMNRMKIHMRAKKVTKASKQWREVTVKAKRQSPRNSSCLKISRDP
jgi:uncharacterized protein (DUF2342 family)